MKKLILLVIFLSWCFACNNIEEFDQQTYPLNTPMYTSFSLTDYIHYWIDFEKCAHKADGASCSDGIWCNGLEFCENELCKAGEAPCDTSCDEAHQMCAAECVFDSDCNNDIACDGEEWCCSWEKSSFHCEKYHCYKGFSPCGQPIWSVLTVCDCDFDKPCNDACRPCKADHECNDGCWCNGTERCGREDEGNNWGLCLHTIGSRPCNNDEVCDEEWQKCSPDIKPECYRDSDCPGFESWCDENGKCHTH